MKFIDVLAQNPFTREFVPNAQFQVFDVADLTFTTPLTVTKIPTGEPADIITSNELCVVEGFEYDEVQVILKSGDFTRIVNTTDPIPGPPGDDGADGSNVLPTDTAIGNLLDNASSTTRQKLDALYSASDITIIYADLPPGMMIAADYTGSAWPARPTNRTDLKVVWAGPTAAGDPSGAINGDIRVVAG